MKHLIFFLCMFYICHETVFALYDAFGILTQRRTQLTVCDGFCVRFINYGTLVVYNFEFTGVRDEIW